MFWIVVVCFMLHSFFAAPYGLAVPWQPFFSGMTVLCGPNECQHSLPPNSTQSFRNLQHPRWAQYAHDVFNHLRTVAQNLSKTNMAISAGNQLDSTTQQHVTPRIVLVYVSRTTPTTDRGVVAFACDYTLEGIPNSGRFLNMCWIRLICKWFLWFLEIGPGHKRAASLLPLSVDIPWFCYSCPLSPVNGRFQLDDGLASWGSCGECVPTHFWTYKNRMFFFLGGVFFFSIFGVFNLDVSWCFLMFKLCLPGRPSFGSRRWSRVPRFWLRKKGELQNVSVTRH